MQVFPKTTGVLDAPGANASTAGAFISKTGSVYLYVAGSGRDVATYTMEISVDGGVTYETYTADLDGTDVGVSITWANADGKPNLRRFILSDVWVRVTTSGGGSPTAKVRISGDNVHIKPAA